MTTTTPTHEQERQAILKEYPLIYFIAASVLLLGLGIIMGALLFGQNNDHAIDYFSNVYLTIISTAFTVIVIDRLNRRRDEQRAESELKAQLLWDVRSGVKDVAMNAIHQMQVRGWLESNSGLLKNTNLGSADLSGARLSGVNLGGAVLSDGNLSNAKLFSANLSGAMLRRTNLSGANLSGANLDEANLVWTNLSGANLSDVNLKGAKLKSAIFDEATLLPDMTRWKPDTDMNRFTDPLHPHFWRSDDPNSPAYSGKNNPPAQP